jgi:hypothetical protein
LSSFVDSVCATHTDAGVWPIVIDLIGEVRRFRLSHFLKSTFGGHELLSSAQRPTAIDGRGTIYNPDARPRRRREA